MKPLSLLITAFVFATLTFTSCVKCQICTQDSEPEVRICRNDYSNNTQYGLALDFKEAEGYDCR